MLLCRGACGMHDNMLLEFRGAGLHGTGIVGMWACKRRAGSYANTKRTISMPHKLCEQ